MSKKKPEIKPIQESRPYVLWRRVSTEDQGQSGLGLEAQKTIAEAFMGRVPVEVFTDVFSGTKLRQCKGLRQAIELCKAKDYVLVIAKSDRCRNVSEALDILDAMGERNLIFCDLPTCDRFILTIMWAMWERQAIMGRINTRIALAERKKQIDRDGGFISNSGKWCDHLGRHKGADLTKAVAASAQKSMAEADEWRQSSPLFLWTENQLLKGRSRKDIIREAAELYDKDPVGFGTRRGCPLSEAILSRWASYILPKS